MVMDEARLIKLYSEQPRAVDDLPYTPELDELVEAYNSKPGPGTTPRLAYKALQRLRKAGKLVRKGRGNGG